MCTFIPIWGAIWVFGPWGRGGGPKTPLHIKTFTPLGVRNFQQKFQETLSDASVCLRKKQSLNTCQAFIAKRAVNLDDIINLGVDSYDVLSVKQATLIFDENAK